VIVVADASVVVPALVDGGSSGDAARAALSATDLLAPALLDVEVVHVLRGRVRAGKLVAALASHALDRLAELPIERYDAVPLLSRMWELRDNLTAYDASYVALAEVFEATLVTADLRQVEASGPRCAFRHVTAGG
jgi:predicted nucleic acid-binding protein